MFQEARSLQLFSKSSVLRNDPAILRTLYALVYTRNLGERYEHTIHKSAKTYPCKRHCMDDSCQRHRQSLLGAWTGAHGPVEHHWHYLHTHHDPAHRPGRV